MRTRPILAAAALLLAAGLAAVTHGVVSQADEPLRIGTTYMTMNNPFYSVIDEELRLVIESRGDILLTRDPALDQERQNEEIRDLLTCESMTTTGTPAFCTSRSAGSISR